MDTTNETQERFPSQPAPHSGNIGALAAAVIIVLLIAAGGFYFLYSEQEKQRAGDAAQAGNAQVQQETAAQEDTTQDIEADLNATATGGTEQDVSELEQAL